ncbi:hypothetical protein AKO1_006830 [Acrasis kona]|uniref:Potassium channel tetramerisation-type BTB domain-containing protein n=1 Tax=Acrasis kona TaxID=1008807 RepID=A0AAW2YTV6_9EUKA
MTNQTTLDERLAALEQKLQQLSKTEEIKNEKILLNIGGAVFTTSRETLTKIPDSYLAKLVSKTRNSFTPYEYFIDRNSNRFEVILEHLRGEDIGHVFDNRRESDVEDIKRDVVFYGITSMRKYFRTLRIEDEERIKRENMVKGVFNGVHTGILKGHEDYVRCIILLKNGKLATGSADKTIKVWDIQTKTCEFTLDAGDDVKSMCELKTGVLACRAGDSLVMFDLRNKTKFKTLVGLGSFDVLDLNNNTFALYGSGDNIRILDMEGLEVGQLRGEPGDYSHPGMVLLSDNRVVTYNYYQKFELWDLNTYKCIRSWKDEGSSSLSGLSPMSGNQFVAIYGRGQPKVWTVDDESSNQICVGDKHSVRADHAVQLTDGSIAALCELQYIKNFDKNTGELKTGIEHPRGLSLLCAIPDGGVVTSFGARYEDVYIFA